MIRLGELDREYHQIRAMAMRVRVPPRLMPDCRVAQLVEHHLWSSQTTVCLAGQPNVAAARL